MGPEGQLIGMDTVMRPAPKTQAAAEQQNQQQQ
jgi:hypothetical protein